MSSDKKQLIIKTAYPRRNVRCVTFMATAGLLAVMIAAGIPVRRHPLEPWQYITPAHKLSKEKFWELLNDNRFLFIANLQLLVSPTNSLQSFTIPSSWNSGNNSIQCIGGGGSGGVTNNNIGSCATGGGAGAWARSTNLNIAPMASVSYLIAPGGAFVSTTALSSTIGGNVGGDTWFDGGSLGASFCGAKGGLGGSGGVATAPGVSGGSSGSCVFNSAAFSGGASGSTAVACTSTAASGGGGSAGPSGAGSASAGSVDNATNGGNADNNIVGGAGPGSNGNSGTEFDGSHGCGSGGGANLASLAGAIAGSGGNYGGGGGGCSVYDGGSPGYTNQSGAGAQGIIAVTWTAASRGILAGTIG